MAFPRLKVALLGRYGLAHHLFVALEGHFEVATVVSAPKEVWKINSELVWEWAVSRELSTINVVAERWREELEKVKCDLFVSCGFPKKLGKEELLQPRLGAINLHQSLLPLHRGSSPVEATVICGDREIGMTVHKMSEMIDAGNILCQLRMPLIDQDSLEHIVRKMNLSAPALVLTAIQLLLDGADGIEQNEQLASYSQRIDLPWQRSIGYLRENFDQTRFKGR